MPDSARAVCAGCLGWPWVRDGFAPKYRGKDSNQVHMTVAERRRCQQPEGAVSDCKVKILQEFCVVWRSCRCILVCLSE